jgi:mitochondrial fission protein ELM1
MAENSRFSLPLTWIITEGLAGTENQCLGVAEALGVTPEIKRVSLKQPWKLLSPYLGFEKAASFAPPLCGPWPDLLIASGRKSIAASRYIKKASGGKTFTVQIQDPRISLAHFDLVAVPQHDPARGKNVIVTQATPNRITQEKLHQARSDFEKELSFLPSPRIAVLIGGKTKSHNFTLSEAEELATLVLPLVQQGAGVMITTSRRTGKENEEKLCRLLTAPNTYFWKGGEKNPYLAFLALADFILVTAESTSMISDAATTGKPVYVLPMKGLSKRQGLLVQNLREAKIINDFKGTLEKRPYVPLQDAKAIADKIRRQSGLFQSHSAPQIKRL